MASVVHVELSTDAVPEAQRLEFWFSNTGGRMACSRVSADTPVHARVTALAAPGIEFMNYESRGFIMDRTRRMCATDDRDEISIGLVASPTTGALHQGREMKLRRGDLYVIDFAHPVTSVLPDHQEMAIFLPRAAVRAAVGDTVDKLGGHVLRTNGMSGLLAAHMRALAAEAAFLNENERDVAMRVMAELALATMSAPMANGEAPEQFAHGLYAAALQAIGHHCADHEFDPARLAQLLGCSRASLYRLFARFGEGVAEAIWAARLERARTQLQRDPFLSVSDAAYRSGFLDLSSFARMYRRRFGHAPRETRDTVRRPAKSGADRP